MPEALAAITGACLRALAGMAHPRVLWLTVAPFLLCAVLWGAAFWFGWEAAVGLVRQWLSQWPALHAVETAVTLIGLTGLHLVFAPFLVVAVALPLIVATILILIGITTMPAVVRHVGKRRYPALIALHGGGVLGSLGVSLTATLVFLAVFILTSPLWFIPPFLAIVPPALWGWLSYRIMAYDALADHASGDERRLIMQRHRWPLLTIGVITGFLGALPAMLWATSLLAIVLFPVIAVLSVWLYVLIFVFSALWFTHYCLSALARLREGHGNGEETWAVSRRPGSTSDKGS